MEKITKNSRGFEIERNRRDLMPQILKHFQFLPTDVRFDYQEMCHIIKILQNEVERGKLVGDVKYEWYDIFQCLGSAMFQVKKVAEAKELLEKENQ